MTFSETLFKPQEYRLINATVRETPMLKKYLNYWNRPFLVRQFIENQVFTRFILVFSFIQISVFMGVSHKKINNAL